MKKHTEEPIKIAWNEYARGFYCPACLVGVENRTHQCKYCGQLLLNRYEREEKHE